MPEQTVSWKTLLTNRFLATPEAAMEDDLMEILLKETKFDEDCRHAMATALVKHRAVVLQILEVRTDPNVIVKKKRNRRKDAGVPRTSPPVTHGP